MSQLNPSSSHLKQVLFLACLFSIVAILLTVRPTGAANSGASATSVDSAASDQPISPAAIILVVNDAGDAADTNIGDSICDVSPTAGEQCTLRAALQETNAAAGDDTIAFSASLNNSTITLNSALPDVSGNLTVTGPGASLLSVRRSTAGGTPAFRIFTISPGRTVAISGLAIANGNVTGSHPASSGGGILIDSATATLNNVVVSGNSADVGGGINTSGSIVTINESTISHNIATSSGGGINNNSTASPVLSQR